jgi:hypothetical protein
MQHRRLTQELRRGSWKVNRKLARRSRREEGIKIVRTRKSVGALRTEKMAS